MPSNKIELAQAFLSAHPAQAAHVLEQEPLKDVAEFLSMQPQKIGAPVLARMLPPYTASLCNIWSPAISAEFLMMMDIGHATTILRHISAERRPQIINLLPQKFRLTCTLLLNYAEDNVGAWMHVQSGAIPIECKVGEALQRLAGEEQTTAISTVYVVDRERNLVGSTSFTALLRANADNPVKSIMNVPPQAIRGRNSLLAVENHTAWSALDILPVVDKNNRLVGVLRHVDLRRGLAKLRETIDSAQPTDPISNLFSVYSNSMLALFNTFGGMLQSSEPRRGEQGW